MRAFLSHSSIDKPLASKIHRILRDEAVAVWFDRLEIKPGDSLLNKIADGIDKSDYLLVLISENSKKSNWVEKEMVMALTQEMSGRGPKVIPILIEGNHPPTLLADKLYVKVDQHGNGILDIATALFSSSYLLDIDFNEKMEVNEHNLIDGLYEYVRSNLLDIRVRINHRNFNHRILNIIKYAVSDPSLAKGIVAQLEEEFSTLHVELQIFWVNLCNLLSGLLMQIFAEYGKSLDTVKTAVVSVTRTLKFAQWKMYNRLRSGIFPHYAEKLEHPDLFAYLKEFDGYDDSSGAKESAVVVKICQFISKNSITDLEVAGKPLSRIRDGRFILPISNNDFPAVQMTCPPEAIIIKPEWYFYCLPQLVGNFLSWTSFREGKPTHELDYSLGFSMTDYKLLGLR